MLKGSEINIIQKRNREEDNNENVTIPGLFDLNHVDLNHDLNRDLNHDLNRDLNHLIFFKKITDLNQLL